MRLLAIANTRTAAHDLARVVIGERMGTATEVTSVREVTLRTPMGGSPFDAAVLALPSEGLTLYDVEWIEGSVLTRLVRNGELVVRFVS